MNRRSLAALSAGVVFGIAAPASAQVWLQDRQLTQGRGIRVGNFELHPGIGAEVGYDSNVFYAANNPTSALRLRVTPSLYVSSLGPQRSTNSDAPATALPTVNFRGGVALIYHEFISLQSPDTTSNLRNLGVDGNLRFEFFPGRTWQFVISDDFLRTIQPGAQTNTGADGVLLPAQTFNRNYNTASAELAYAPPRGTLEFRLGYSFIFNLFDSTNYNFYDYLGHSVYGRMRWRFLPKTALLWEGSVTPTNYIHPDRAPTGLFSSFPVSTRVGINGLLTEKISLLALVGYQASFFQGGDNIDTIIGQAELRWLINPRANFRVGFLRDSQNSFFSNFFVRNRGYLNYSHSFNGRFILSLEGGVGLYQYGYVADRNGRASVPVSGSGSDGRFTSVRVDATAFGEYRFNEVFGINATVRGLSNISDVRLGNSTGTDGGRGQPIAWSRVEAFIGVRAAW
jgi:hypothetical protein